MKQRISKNTNVIVRRTIKNSDADNIIALPYKVASRDGWLSTSSGTVNVTVTTADGNHPVVETPSGLYKVIYDDFEGEYHG